MRTIDLQGKLESELASAWTQLIGRVLLPTAAAGSCKGMFDRRGCRTVRIFVFRPVDAIKAIRERIGTTHFATTHNCLDWIEVEYMGASPDFLNSL